MDHLQVDPHLSLSDRGRPQSNIHTPRTRSYFSIPLHPRLPFFPILHSHVLILSSSQVFSASHCHLHDNSSFLYHLELGVDIYSLPCISCSSFHTLWKQWIQNKQSCFCVCSCASVCLPYPDWPIVPPLTQWMSLRPSCQHGRTRCQDWRADCGLVALLCRGPLRCLPLFSKSFPENADRKKSCCHIHRWYKKIREQGYKGQREKSIVF